MIELNWDLLAAGTVATTLHLAGFVVLSGADSPETRPSEMPAAEVMSVVLVAPPAERVERAAMQQQRESSPHETEAPDPIELDVPAQEEWVRRADPHVSGSSTGEGVTAVLGAPAPTVLALDEQSGTLVAPRRLEPSAGRSPGPSRLPAIETPPSERPRVELPDEVAPSPPPARSAAPVVPPVAIRNDPPEYPSLARERGQEGTVELLVHVLANGSSGTVEVRRSSGHAMLDRAARRAARRWRFTPATRDGRAIDMWIEIPVRFNLEEESVGAGP